MRKLKCSSCGGMLGLFTTPEGHVVGVCESCGTRYVIEAHGRRHVVLEHRFPDGKPALTPVAQMPGQFSRRAAFGAALGVATAVGAMLVVPRMVQPRRNGQHAKDDVVTIFNIGGEGAAPGLFRDYINAIDVDSLGRAIIEDSEQRTYVFGPDGSFLAQFAQPDGAIGQRLGVLPDGDIVMDGNSHLLRVDPLTGKIKKRVPVPDNDGYWVNGEGSCVTADGGLALYFVARQVDGQRPSMPGKDTLVLLDRNLKERRRLHHADRYPQR